MGHLYHGYVSHNQRVIILNRAAELQSSLEAVQHAGGHDDCGMPGISWNYLVLGTGRVRLPKSGFYRENCGFHGMLTRF